MKMIYLPTSSNKKTGDIMQSYSSRSTCPKSCVFKNNGCYAEGCHTKMVWDRCEDKNDAAHKGFLINASCATVEEVKHAKALGINAVITSVDPKETEKELKAVGLYGAQCPAQVKEGMDCNHCQLCAKNRKVVIIFGIHGAHKGKARKAIQIHRAKASNLANLK